MKLKLYTSILTAAMLLAGSIQSIPVTAHTAAASAVTEKAPDADTKAEPKDSEEAVPAPETTDPSADGMTAAETVQTTAVSDDSGPAETVMTEKPDPVQIAADSLGEKITWALDSDGHLRIRGAGAMSDGTGCPFGYDAGKVTDAVIENTDPEDPITVLKPDLFHGCQNLTSVTLPDSIRVIGSEAFRDCTALKEIALPDHLAEIGTAAFRNTGLTEAILPGCTLGDGAFYDNNELQKVSIGEGTLTIPSECFRYCSALETVTLPDSLKEIQSGEYDSMGACAECPSLRSVSIGKGIESISQYAFRTTGSDLAVTFREGVTAIPESAFSGRGELKTVILPDTLESIGSSAFRNCPNLTGTVFPASLREIGAAAFRNTGLTEAILPGCTLGAYAFYDSEKLKEVSIGEGTPIIPGECFRYCSALETVTLPDSVTEIRCGEYDSTGAFAECPSLRSVSIGKGIESISQYAFRTTGSDLAVTFREGVTAIPESAFSGRGELKTVILPDTLESIGSSAFRNCPNLTGTVFPASLREIGAAAFRNTGLTEAILPGCTLGAYAFYDSEKLKEVSIGEGTPIIPSECFRYCSALETVTLPDSLKEIQCGQFDSMGAFAECPALKSVSIGKGIESISQHAFRTTGTELDVTFRDGASGIPDNAFRNRIELMRIVVPASAETLGSGAVSRCGNLRAIVFASPGCSIQDNAGEIPESAVIYGYKDSTAEAYAKKYGRIFIPLRSNDPSVPFSCDLNADGKTDSEDAILLLRVVTEVPPADGELDASALGMADLDCSGTLTLKDVSLLLTAITVPPAAP